MPGGQRALTAEYTARRGEVLAHFLEYFTAHADQGWAIKYTAPQGPGFDARRSEAEAMVRSLRSLSVVPDRSGTCGLLLGTATGGLR